jgi:DNA topoisomerase I
MKLVIVESPAKSKTINNYLGNDFKVLASFGHILELPSKDGSIDVNNNFEMHYQIAEKSQKAAKDIIENAKKCDTIYLATDPDREGEAIAASVLEALKMKKVNLKEKTIYRSTFNQITKQAVLNAINNPREIDTHLVNSQKARLSLDYLVGFNISPILWKKLPGSRSAGRVQSVALRIVCERELEIENFIKEEYWTVEGIFNTVNNQNLKTILEVFDSKKLQKLDIKSQEEVSNILAEIQKHEYSVFDIVNKEIKRNPYAPFITSTMQQDASSKLGFSPKKTMLLAQKLYEGVKIQGETKGLITYMRTDSPAISKDGIEKIRNFILSELGEKYRSKNIIQYSSKAKNAQEAHEAIRPVDPTLKPELLNDILTQDELKLYTLIWKRSIASQMSEAIFDNTKIEIANAKNSIKFKASGSILKFDGYQKIYNYSEGNDVILTPVSINDKLNLEVLKEEQHFTSPPARYSEASLVKKLEELGIGRPSTYASTLAVLQDRNYVTLTEKKLIPEERGRIVTAFLESFFPKYLEYNFTAKLEEDLDLISNGDLEKLEFLNFFWNDFSENVKMTESKSPLEVSEAIENKLEKFFFKEHSKECSVCKNGLMHVKIGKFGPFLACSNYPECKNIINSKVNNYEKVEDKLLGVNDKGLDIYLKKGPYGFYVELADGNKKPKRASLTKDTNIDNFTLSEAKSLLVFPRNIGLHPEGGEIIAGIGPYGPYVSYNSKYYRLKSKEMATNLTLEEAIEIIKNAPTKTTAKKTTKSKSK